MKNPITIEALTVLDAIDRRQSFAKAAEELNKATSALSYVVQKLEEQLNITLFERQGRRSVLTHAGKVILVDGRQILQATNQLADKAKQVATGWETKINIAIESVIDKALFFNVLSKFLLVHPSIEIDIRESVLNGGWDALEHDEVNLAVGVPSPVPLQKGFRAVPLQSIDMIPVIASTHPKAHLAKNTTAFKAELKNIRRIVTHDTAKINVTRTVGLIESQQTLYVQNIEQKISAQLAGIGIGYLPRYRVEQYLKTGELIEINLGDRNIADCFLAWKIGNKGKGLKALTMFLSQSGL
ncbi:LysR family transcriptional regulator [Pseudoalteromonas sp. NBT06-2]|uniref:LysR substrate-binding domain-containing protein n=1 Tax=Pseudoalteromonas sp. NBT06-2 TaxID=2025950 RepID=UPI000BA7867E|nr:LysR substrate-binding domain-containing protein [Pseudoalteromonas sp. NBT06-2]PAJ75115.1 LysR family transcriptional regulator [Pseudoalteromonas sp. NBT06-2]